MTFDLPYEAFGRLNLASPTTGNTRGAKSRNYTLRLFLWDNLWFLSAIAFGVSVSG
jgi:hypothetical protein